MTCKRFLTDQRAQQRDRREKHHENNRDIKDQLLNATARLKGCAGAWRAKCAAQTGAADLEQDKKKNGYAQNNLNDANRRKPLLQNSSSLSCRPPVPDTTTGRQNYLWPANLSQSMV